MASGRSPRREHGLLSSSTVDPDFDLSRAVARVRRRWLLLVGCAVAGLLIGYAVGRTGQHGFQARTVLYVTQTGGLAQPAALASMARSPSLLAAAADRTQVSTQELLSSMSATAVGGTRTAGAPLSFQISIRARHRKAAVEASRLIASALLDRVDDYQVAQVAAAKAALETTRRELADVNRRDALAQSLSRSDLAVRATALGLIEEARSTVSRRMHDAETQLAQAKAQQSQIVSTSAVPVGARSLGADAIVGAATGLLLALLASLAFPDPTSSPKVSTPRAQSA
jgi:hypothetical protein